ncbi:Gamma-aminobutyric acid receptor subunit beta [Orchesella cincta]|uniref:Gamma-aminobutyric acid receptor subunit beta n=1 Tax=Orchesella cincta TaxID=48709 RepID=A0A1D2N8I0_ORCCI|nr:Gamma-aminobutyric acid receptor subunit beta [Orchesella cincta]
MDKNAIFLFLSVIILKFETVNLVSVPIAAGGPRTAVFSHLHPSNDTSWEDPTILNNAEFNNETDYTASIMNRIIQSNGYSTEYLEKVQNPEVVANELESAAKFLLHEAHMKGENGSASEDDEKTADLTRVLDGFVLLNNLYDALVRPGQFHGDKRTNVYVHIYLHPWFEVNEQKNEMTVTLTLVQNWTDPRLAYESRLKEPEKLPYVTLSSQMHVVEIWNPDTFFFNEKRSYKHEAMGSKDFTKIFPQGQVSREQTMTITANCPFHLNERFPFDRPTFFLNLTSFSFNADEIAYQWSDNGISIVHSNKHELNTGFRMSVISVSDALFQRDDIEAGSSSGLVLEIEFERYLTLYVTRLYLPLACFTLLSIVGLLSSIGPEIGCALTYFMFGLLSIFMGLSFNGPDFSWGDKRTALDSYYLLCTLTIMVTGILNIFKLRKRSKGDSAVESYEMQRSVSRDFQNSRRERVNNRNGSLWDNNNDDLEDDNVEQDVGSSTKCSRFIECIKSVKNGFVKSTRQCHRFYPRFCNSSSYPWIMLGVFMSWNAYYWIKNLSY